MRNIDETRKLLESSANGASTTACGSSGIPNNVYGHGFLNIEKAVN